jgi:hypothetical protein
MTIDPVAQKPPGQPVWKPILGVIGSIAGFAAGAYAGVNLLVPAIVGSIAAFLLRKTGPAKDWLMITAAAVQIGHAVWILLGSAFIAAGPGFYVEVIFYAVFVAILIWRQAKWTMIVLICYQAFGLVVNSIAFINAPIGSFPSRALGMHLALRGTAVICMALLLRRKPRESFVEAF